MSETENILIVYFSYAGNTGKLANKIHEIVGGDIIEIKLLNPYSDNYHSVENQVLFEQEEYYRPRIKTKIDNIKSYDVILIGSPIWWFDIAPPIKTFLEEHNLSEKKVAFFSTHDWFLWSGKSNDTISEFCSQSILLKRLSIKGEEVDFAKEDVLKWLHEICAIKELGIFNRERRCSAVHSKIMQVLSVAAIVVMVSYIFLSCEKSTIGETALCKRDSFVTDVTAEKDYIPNEEKKVLIAYYSYTGITEDIAERLQEKTGADLFEIGGDFPQMETEKNQYNISDKSSEEDRLPLLKDGIPDISSYDLILVGSPAWWKNSLSTPVMSFLSEVDFEGKEVAPFCIDQGGVGDFFQDFEGQAQNADVLDGLYLKNVKSICDSQKDMDQEINTWLDKINV